MHVFQSYYKISDRFNNAEPNLKAQANFNTSVVLRKEREEKKRFGLLDLIPEYM